MCAIDHPIVAAQTLANFLLNIEQGIANIVGQRRGQVWESSGWIIATLAKIGLDDSIRLRVILIIVRVSLNAGALGTVVGDIRIANHKVVHGGFDRKQILGAAWSDARLDGGAV